MNIVTLIGIVAVCVLLLWGYARFLRWRRPRLSSSAKAMIRKQWAQVLRQTDSRRKVLEADAVLDKVLRELAFSGTMGEKLQKAQSLLKDSNAVWAAHKLRNRIAHETGVTVTQAEEERAVRALGTAIEKFVR